MNFPSFLKSIFVTMIIVTANCYSADHGVKAELSGFGRLVIGQIDDSDLSHYGYEDSVDVNLNSLLGLQGKIKFNEKFSATALGLLQDNNDGSDIDWLYLSYRPTSALNIKLGQMQTPFFSLSDSLDVGYSYPWVIAPKEVYNDFVFKNFQGIDGRYTFLGEGFTAHVEAYCGSFDGDISANNNDIPTKIDGLTGIIGDLRIANFKVRASYHFGDLQLFLPETDDYADLLSASGFPRSAASLESDGDAEFYQFGAEYDSLTYFLKAEWTTIQTESQFLRDVHNYYLSYGYYFDKVTALITYAHRKEDVIDQVDEIPLGVSEQLDQLAAGYSIIFNAREKDDIDSWALSLRWDFRKNMALKAEYKHTKSKFVPSSAFLTDREGFDQSVNLYVAALEWVF